MSQDNNEVDASAVKTAAEIASIAYGPFLSKAIVRHTEVSSASMFNTINIDKLVDHFAGELKKEVEEENMMLSDSQFEHCRKAIGFSFAGGYRCWFALRLNNTGTFPEPTRDGPITAQVASVFFDKVNNGEMEISPVRIRVLAEYASKVLAEHVVPTEFPTFILNTLTSKVAIALKAGLTYGVVEEQLVVGDQGRRTETS